MLTLENNSFLPSDDRVLYGVGEGMAQMQTPCDIRWRDAQHEHTLRVGLRNTAALQSQQRRI